MEIREHPPNPPHLWSTLVMAESLRWKPICDSSQWSVEEDDGI